MMRVLALYALAGCQIAFPLGPPKHGPPGTGHLTRQFVHNGMDFQPTVEPAPYDGREVAGEAEFADGASSTMSFDATTGKFSFTRDGDGPYRLVLSYSGN